MEGVANRLTVGSDRRDLGHRVDLPANDVQPTWVQYTGQPWVNPHTQK